MVIGDCIKCDKVLYKGDVARHFPHTDVFVCNSCHDQDQPERSKREDSCTHELEEYEGSLFCDKCKMP